MYKFKDSQYVVLKSRKYFDIHHKEWAKIGQVYKVFIGVLLDDFIPFIVSNNEPTNNINRWYLYDHYQEDFDFACPYQEFEEVSINLP